jgi:hypothetical protein
MRIGLRIKSLINSPILDLLLDSKGVGKGGGESLWEETS